MRGKQRHLKPAMTYSPGMNITEARSTVITDGGLDGLDLDGDPMLVL